MLQEIWGDAKVMQTPGQLDANSLELPFGRLAPLDVVRRVVTLRRLLVVGVGG